MNRIDRYVFREVASPTIVAFLAYTGIMLIRGLFQFAELVLQSGNPGRDLLIVLGFSLPHIVVLTIPVAMLLGVLVGIGRLSADSELIALRASGVDLVRLYRPIGILSGICFGLTLWVLLSLVPRGNQMLFSKKLELSTFIIAQRIQPGVFSPDIAGRRIYVERASSDRRTLEGIIVSDRSDPAGERLTLARSGVLELEEAEGRLWLRLRDAVTHRLTDQGAGDEQASYDEQRILLEDTNPRERVSRLNWEKQLREQSLPELLQRTRTAKTPTELRMTWVEIQKKFSFPVGCLVFGFIALPLGVVTRRGGRSAGFAVSTVIVLGYYVLIASGEARAIEGQWSPATAMWLPNVILVVFGIWALRRVRRDLPLFPVPSLPAFRRRKGSTVSTVPSADMAESTISNGSSVYSEAPATPPPPTAGPDSPPARRSRTGSSLRGGFLLDRYVSSRFLGVFFLVLFSIVTLYVVIEFMEISDDIAKNNPPATLLFSYFRALLAPVLYDVVPYAFLVAALVAVAGMVRSSETTAILSHGISLHRAAAPILLLAVACGFGLWLFSEHVVPRASSDAERLRLAILGRPEAALRGPGQVWFRGESGRFFAGEAVSSAKGTVADVTVIEIDTAAFRLVRRVDAPRATLIPGRGLAFPSGWERVFGASGTRLGGRRETPFVVEAPEAARVFQAGALDPRQMTSPQLSRFILARRQSGADVSALETGLQQRSAAALSTLLLTLLGLPSAFRHGKRGAVAGIGIALLIGLGYLAFSTITVKLGTSGALVPVLAAWGPNVLFGLWAARGLLGIRT